MSTEKPAIILFDGVCKFCHASVRFVIKRDTKNRFLFCPIQSTIGQALMTTNNLADSELTSMILLENTKIFRKSSAALRIARRLNMPWPLLYGFIVVPVIIRDWVYDFIGDRRYRWFGKYDSCWIPNDESRKKFID